MENYEWYNHNSHRKYPFQGQCSLQTIGRTFTLPNTLFVDGCLQMSYQFQNMYFMNKLEYSPERLYVEISNTDGVLALQGTLSGSIVYLIGTGTFTKSVGKLIIGSLDDLPYGVYQFYPANTLIETCRVLKLSTGISSINGITDGNINLTSKTNVRITKQGSNIVIDTQDGLCACDDNPCIKTINGISQKNIRIEGVGCVSVNNTSNGVKIENTCEKSCCGCDQINDFIDQLRVLEARIVALGG